MKNLLQSFLIATVLVTGCYTPPVLAVDTDLFVRDPDDSGTPTIMVMFGNDSSSWSSNFGTNACGSNRSRAKMIHEAMHRILTILGDTSLGGFDLWVPTDTDAENEAAGRVRINIGFGMYSEGTSPPGAKIFKHIKLLDAAQRTSLLNSFYAAADGTPMTSKTIAQLTNDTNCTTPEADATDATPSTFDYAKADDFIVIPKTPGNASISRALAEILRYFRGEQPMSGTQDVGTSDYRDNENNRLDEFAFFSDPNAAHADTEFANLKYRNDFLDSNASCGDKHIIYFGFSRPQASERTNSVKACFSKSGADLSQTCADTKYTGEQLLTGLEGWDFRAFNNGTYITIPTDPAFPSDNYSGDENFVPDEWSQYLFNGIDLDPTLVDNQVIKTHWINVTDNPNKNSTTRADQAFFKSIANNGGGEYELATDADAIVTSFLNILSAILAENSVFASTALPVSVNVRGTNLNQIYLGVFRADVENRARWWGNLKQYKLGINAGTGAIELQDADGNPSQGADGFIDPDARSLWTHTAPVARQRADGSGYWGFDPRGNVIDPDLKDDDNPDGEVVEKGGVAQFIRENFDANPLADREIYTYVCDTTLAACQNPATAVDLEAGGNATQFNTSNTAITAANTGLAAADTTGWSATRLTTLTLANLVNFFRGQDNDTPYDWDGIANTESFGDEDNDTFKDDARPQIHGDVLHSRPAIVNFNRLGDDSDVIVFYGTNDGGIRAIQGGEEDHPNDGSASTGTDPNNISNSLIAAGNEIWSFIAQEHYGKLYQQFENDEVDGGASPRSTIDREIFFDGTFSVLTRDNFNEAAYQTIKNAGGTDAVAATAGTTNLPASNFGDGVRIIREPDQFPGRLATDADEAYLFAAARRGGDLLYAFDISNPYEPAVYWRRRGADAADGSVDGALGTADPGYEELGQTWSAPTPIKLKVDLGSGLEEKDVLIFGKGFNPANDDFEPTGDDPLRPTNTAGNKSIGAGVMIVDADTGDPIWQSGTWTSYPITSPGEYVTVSDMVWSIPSDVTPVDRDRDTFFEKFYVGDSGGNVWRGDISDSDPANWTVTQLADLADHSDNKAYCTVSNVEVDKRSDCTNYTCDQSGDTVTDPLDCRYICSDGSLEKFAINCTGSGFSCSGGSQVATSGTCPFNCQISGSVVPAPNSPNACPTYTCDLSGNQVTSPNQCKLICDFDGTTLVDKANQCPGPNPKKASNRETATQETAVQQSETSNSGATGQESATQEFADLLYGDDDRRFLFAPDLVPNSDPEFDAILLGSGDRELPDSAYVEDRFYMLKDPWVDGSADETSINAAAFGAPGSSDGVIAPLEQAQAGFSSIYPITDATPDAASSPGLDAGADLYNATNNTIQQGTADTLNPDGSVNTQGTQSVARDALAAARGWYINLIGPKPVGTGTFDGDGNEIFVTSSDDDDTTTQLGEKVVSSAVTLGGTVFFNTNEPDDGSLACGTTLGTARSYAINYEDGSVPASAFGSGDLSERFEVLAAGGFPPSPVPFVVEIDGQIYSGVQIGPVPRQADTEVYNQRQRVFWFQDVDIN